MSAELGSTPDPVQLVPGAPDELRRQADVLDTRARDAEGVGDALRRIEAGAWTGPAADSWRRAHDAQVSRWHQAADSLGVAARALRVHAEVLEWAQRRAATTVAIWREAEQSTADAPRSHDQAVAAGHVSTVFTDPGGARRQEAQDSLDDARSQVVQSSSRLAEVLRSEAEIAPRDSQQPMP